VRVRNHLGDLVRCQFRRFPGRPGAYESRDCLQGKERADQQEIEGGKDEFLPAKGVEVMCGESPEPIVLARELRAQRFLLGLFSIMMSGLAHRCAAGPSSKHDAAIEH
jgi:hypothetical protein